MEKNIFVEFGKWFTSRRLFMIAFGLGASALAVYPYGYDPCVMAASLLCDALMFLISPGLAIAAVAVLVTGISTRVEEQKTRKIELASSGHNVTAEFTSRRHLQAVEQFRVGGK